MFDIELSESGVIEVSGRLDAAHAEKAQTFLDEVPGAMTLDMGRLDYISSAGLGVLLKTQKRLMAGGGGLRLVNVSRHINDIFRYSGFDKLFEIEAAESS